MFNPGPGDAIDRAAGDGQGRLPQHRLGRRRRRRLPGLLRLRADGVKTWADMMSRKAFILGSTGKGAGNYINGAVLRQVFNAPVRQILGFPGSAEQRIAIERGELDGDCGAFASIPIAWVNEKKVHPFVRFSEKKQRGHPGQRGLYRHLRQDRRAARALERAQRRRRDRPAVHHVEAGAGGPAGDPAPGVHATMKDPAFLADMEKLGHPVQPLPRRDGGSDRREDVGRLARGAEEGAGDLRVGTADGGCSGDHVAMIAHGHVRLSPHPHRDRPHRRDRDGRGRGARHPGRRRSRRRAGGGAHGTAVRAVRSACHIVPSRSGCAPGSRRRPA